MTARVGGFFPLDNGTNAVLSNTGPGFRPFSLSGGVAALVKVTVTFVVSGSEVAVNPFVWVVVMATLWCKAE